MDTKALFNIGYGLYVLTTKDGKDNGCIINTVMQVTGKPVLLVVGVSKQNFTHDMIVNTKAFNLSILTESAPFSIFEHFGFHSGKDTDKFSDFADVARSENGLLYLTKETNSFLSCQVKTVTDMGSHSLFTVELTDASVLNQDNAMTYAYYHQNVKPKPNATAKKGWRCKICNFIYEGEDLPPDYICPVCKHGAADFVKIS